MNVFFYSYSLMPRRGIGGLARPGPREGALIRAAGGFADVHPWPELGDLPIDEQLARLARGDTTPLTWASLRLARADGAARERGVSLFEGLTIPKSHWPGADPPPRFDTAKVKLGAPLPPHVRLRIDCNAQLTPGEFLRLAQTLPKDRVDFVEDPTRYDERMWNALRQQTRMRLALDRESRASGAFDVLMHKPALHADWPSFDGEIVVTSYMDHPVGQFGAAYVAASHRASARCGLFTHVLFENDPFIERVAAAGSRLLPPEGTGVGFDDLLESLPWKKLV